MQDILGKTIHPGDVIAYCSRHSWDKGNAILRSGSVSAVRANGTLLVMPQDRNPREQSRAVVLKSSKNVVVIPRG